MIANTEHFPTHVFPKALEEFIIESADALNCPVDFIAMSVLSCFALAVGSKAVAEVKRDWKESPVLFAAIVAEPGAKKSPALKMGTLAVNILQKEYAETYKLQKKAFLDNLQTYDEALSTWKMLTKTERQTKEKPQKPLPPTLEQITTNDATIEALSGLLQKQPLGIIFIQDELVGWVKGMNQYRQGNGSDQEKWLSFWSCADTIINRKSEEEPQYLYRPFVNVLGCIQPDVLEELSKNKDNGFIDRILFVMPEPVELNYTDKEVDEALKTSTIRAFKKIYFQKISGETPMSVKFTKESHDKFSDYLNNSLYKEMNSAETPYFLRGILSKFAGYTVRFALIIEAIKFGYGESEFNDIGADSIEKAIELTAFFKFQAAKVQDILHSSVMDKKINQAIKWIKKRGGKCSFRDVYTKKVAGCKNKTQAQKLVDEMQDRSLISIEKIKPDTGGKETIFLILKGIKHQPIL